MSVVHSFRKDPQSVLDYGIDWSTWLKTEAEVLADTDSADTISTSTWTVPAGIIEDSDSKADRATTIWLSGGTAGTNYILANKIVTVGGRTCERSIEIIVEQR